MLTIARLFGKSPFAPLQSHMNKVASCIDKLVKIFESISKKELDKIERLADDLSQLEHEADLTKNDIRNHLPKSLFMPMERGHFLEILSLQDSIADRAEEVGITLTLRPIQDIDGFKEELFDFFKKCIAVFWDTKRIIEEIDELLESSFGGIEAEKVKSMVEEAAHKEYLSQVAKRAMLHKLFTIGDNLTPSGFNHWLRLIEEMSSLAKTAEKLANRIRMVLELK